MQPRCPPTPPSGHALHSRAGHTSLSPSAPESPSCAVITLLQSRSRTSHASTATTRPSFSSPSSICKGGDGGSGSAGASGGQLAGRKSCRQGPHGEATTTTLAMRWVRLLAWVRLHSSIVTRHPHTRTHLEALGSPLDVSLAQLPALLVLDRGEAAESAVGACQPGARGGGRGERQRGQAQTGTRRQAEHTWRPCKHASTHHMHRSPADSRRLPSP